jgi:hypothetical protein
MTARGHAAPLATGCPALDDIAGGLPRPALTELVCSTASCGSQLLVGQLLTVTRAAALRVSLVDANDAFDPCSWPASVLEHLVWVRARDVSEALAATDLLVRDANLALVMLDLRHAATKALRRVPASNWHRLQRALEPTTLAALVITPFALVPSAQLRLELDHAHALSAQAQARPALNLALTPLLQRRRTGELAATG